MDFRNLRSVVALLLLAATGCTVIEHKDEGAAEVPAGESAVDTREAFEEVEEANRRLGGTLPVVIVPRPLPPEPEPETSPEPDLWSRVIDRFELGECRAGSAAERWAEWYAGHTDYMARVFNRARPWLPDIVAEVERRDLPGELALLPIVESAFDPFAYSHGRAAGSWQFLAGTAREYGLEINDWYDGRRDVYAATRAALDYLEFLNRYFNGDWGLALAAYNAGPGRVQRAVRRNQARGRDTRFPALALPRETRGYLPKLRGLGCLFSEPAAFNFSLPEMDDEPHFELVNLPGPTDVVIAARLADMDIAELVALNPGLSRHMTPPGGPHYLLVPPGKAGVLAQALAGLPERERIVWREIRVRRGDTLSELARENGTSTQALREANNLDGDHLSIGQVLRLPAEGKRSPDPEYAATYEKLAGLQQRLLPQKRFRHRVRPGESLWVIARRYNVTIDDIRRWNSLGSSSLIRPDDALTIYGGNGSGGETVQYTVRRGDSIWKIARSHDVTMQQLLRWNGLNRDSVLRPGQKLTIRSGGDA